MSFVLYVKQPLPSTPPFKLGSICIFQRYYGPLWIIIVAMVIGQVVTMRLHYKQVEALTCSDHLILSCIYSRPKRCYSVNATHRKWRQVWLWNVFLSTLNMWCNGRCNVWVLQSFWTVEIKILLFLPWINILGVLFATLNRLMICMHIYP